VGRSLNLWVPVVAWMGVLFHASSQADVSGFGRFPDWLTHGAAYLVLSLLVCRALAGGVLLPLSARAAALAVVLCAAYGASDEYHQSFVPGRDASAGDVASDLGGAAIGAFVWRRGAGARSFEAQR